MELLNGIHSIPDSYSRLNKDLNRLFSNRTIEKVKEKVTKKINTNIFDDVCKMKVIEDEDNEKKNYDE